MNLPITNPDVYPELDRLTGGFVFGYYPLSAFVPLPRNAKDHDIGLLHQSVDRWGFLELPVVNQTTGHTLAGHGRVETLTQKRHIGEQPPDGIFVADGDWQVPTFFVTIAADQEELIAIALNKTTEAGGWHTDLLATVLAEHAQFDENALIGTGFTDDDVDMLLSESLTVMSEADGADLPGEAERPATASYGIVVSLDTIEAENALYERLSGDGYRVKRRGGVVR